MDAYTNKKIQMRYTREKFVHENNGSWKSKDLTALYYRLISQRAAEMVI